MFWEVLFSSTITTIGCDGAAWATAVPMLAGAASTHISPAAAATARPRMPPLIARPPESPADCPPGPRYSPRRKLQPCQPGWVGSLAAQAGRDPLDHRGGGL